MGITRISCSPITPSTLPDIPVVLAQTTALPMQTIWHPQGLHSYPLNTLSSCSLRKVSQ